MASTRSRCSDPSTTCLMMSGRLVTRPRGLRSTESMSHPNLVAITTCPLCGASASPTSFLVDIRAVDLSGVEEGDAAIDSSADQRDHLLPVRPVAIAAGHAHASQSNGGDLQTGAAQSALVHRSYSCRRLRTWPLTGHPRKMIHPAVRACLTARRWPHSQGQVERLLGRTKSMAPRAATQSPQPVLPIRPARSNTGNPG